MGRPADLGITIDWALVNEAARDWVRGYTMELVRGIDDTAASLLQKEIAQWMESGKPLSKLTATLSDYLARTGGADRMTETTRAYNEATCQAGVGGADRQGARREAATASRLPLHASITGGVMTAGCMSGTPGMMRLSALIVSSLATGPMSA